MEVLFESTVYENPLPQLRSRGAAFPFFVKLSDGTILCSMQIGEAFESVDGTTYLSESRDGGRTFSKPWKAFDTSSFPVPITDSAKLTLLPDGRIMALGYAYYRPDPEKPIGNPENGGILDDFVFYAVSEDAGRTFGPLTEIPTAWNGHTEASGPVIVLAEGTLLTPITGFPDWKGRMHGRLAGRALRSEDGGKTWSDDTICMSFSGDCVTCYEMRMTELMPGIVGVIGWNENVRTGERLNNHVTLSTDGGRTFLPPMDTGIRGQASSILSLGGTSVLTLHALRRDTDTPGILAVIADLTENGFEILDQKLIWQPDMPIVKSSHMAEIFSFLKFGQPGAIRLDEKRVLVSFWTEERGLYKTKALELTL